MKKTFGLLLVIFLFSCSKDSVSKYSDNIVGSWQLTSGEPASNFDPCDFQGYTTFKSDNTLLDIDACAYINSTGLWRITDNILTVSNDEAPFPVDIQILSISDSKMVLKFMGDTETYTKVPDSQVKPVTAQCKFCKQVSINTSTGDIVSSGTESKYCGTELLQIEATPSVTILGVTTKWECHTK